jgi:hypothetical protein
VIKWLLRLLLAARGSVMGVVITVLVQVLVALSGFVQEVIGNVVSGFVPKVVLDQLQNGVPGLVFAFVVLALLNQLFVVVAQKSGVSDQAVDYNKARFLGRVRLYLNESLRARLRDVRATLDLQAHQGPLSNPQQAKMELRTAFEQGRIGALQPTIKLVSGGHREVLTADFLEEQGNADVVSLLILGDPGAGKSVILTRLGLAMCRAAQPVTNGALIEAKPVPVLLNLSTWGEQGLPLEEWILRKISQVYGVGVAVVKHAWERNDLCLLLDGLDELNESKQASCVRAINALLLKPQRNLNLVVCSRNQNYVGLINEKVTLNLPSTWQIQPLSDALIFRHLHQVGDGTRKLRETLVSQAQSSSALWQLIRVPLYLQVVTVALENEPVPEVGPLEIKTHIWRKYVARMLDRATGERESTTPKQGHALLRPYSKVEAMRYLEFMALTMDQYRLSEWSLEWLQPVYLPRVMVPAFNWTVRLGSAVLFGALGMLAAQHWTGVAMALSGFGVTFLPILFLLVVYKAMLYSDFSMLLIMIVVSVMFGPKNNKWENSKSLSGRLERTKILQTRVMGFSVRKGLGEGAIALMVGLFVTLTVTFVLSSVLTILQEISETYTLDIALIRNWAGTHLLLMVLALGLTHGFFKAWVPKLESDLEFRAVNEGTWRTVRRGVVYLFSGVLVAASIDGLAFWLQRVLLDGRVQLPFPFFPMWIYMGVLFSHNYVFMAAYHLLLRICFWRAGISPRNYVHFLEVASNMLLLSRRGGGFAFIHKELQDYFAWVSRSDLAALPQHLRPRRRS